MEFDLDEIIARKGEGKTTPEVETPEVETPKVETPEVETPEIETHEIETPEAETPEVEAPDVETPEVETPKPPVFDLDEQTVDVDGESRSVNSVLEERNEYKARIEAVEKDEFLMRFLTHYQATGDATAFLESQAVDWDKQDDISVLRKNFDKENSDLDSETRDLLFTEELESKYKIDPYASDEDVDKESASYKLGQGLKKRDAERARAKFKEEQKKFAIPEKPKEAAPVDAEKAKQEYKKKLVSDEAVAKLLDKKLVQVDVGEDGAFGYEVGSPEKVVEMMADDDTFWKTFIDPKSGAVNRALQAKVYAFASDPAAYEKQLVAFGKTLGEEARLKEGRNTDGILDGKKTKDTGGASQSFGSGFLQAAREQKKKV